MLDLHWPAFVESKTFFEWGAAAACSALCAFCWSWGCAHFECCKLVCVALVVHMYIGMVAAFEERVTHHDSRCSMLKCVETLDACTRVAGSMMHVMYSCESCHVCDLPWHNAWDLSCCCTALLLRGVCPKPCFG